MQLKTFTNEQGWIDASVQFLVDAVGNGGTMALSGGNTPAPVYRAFAESADVSLNAIDIYIVDERCVPRTDDRSNYKKITHALGRDIHAFDPSMDIEASLQQYNAEVQKAVPFDVVVLGMGPDGHTAGLFPNSAALNEENHLVANTQTHEFDVHQRLTLTFPAIMSAKKLLLLLSGKKKQEALDQLLNTDFPMKDFPTKKLLEHPDLTIIFGDY